MYAADYFVRPTNGNDANAGTSYAAAFKTMQKAIDTATAGKIIGAVAEAEEVLSAAIDDDTNAGSAVGSIEIISLNAAGDYDGTPYVINGNSAVVNCLAIVGRTNKRWRGVRFKNATGANVLFLTTASTNYVFMACKSSAAGTHGFDNSVAANTVDIIGSDISNNAGSGCGATQANTQWKIRYSSVGLNATNGVTSSTGICRIHNSLIFKNTGNGIVSTTAIHEIVGNVIDGNAIGCVNTTSASNYYFNRFTNNTSYAIQVSTALAFEGNNYYYGNGAKFNQTTGKIHPGYNSVDMLSDGYVDRANNNYALLNGATPAEGRWVAIAMDATNTAYPSIGMAPNPDFPALGKVMADDTVDGVTGTLALSNVLIGAGGTFDEAARNVDPTEAKVEIGTAYKIQNVAKVGTLPGGSLSAPGVPANLSATNVYATSFTLNWGFVALAAYYKVYKDGVQVGGTVAGNSLAITGLAAGTTYSMEVSAGNTAGFSAKSSALAVTTATSGSAGSVQILSTQALASAPDITGVVTIMPLGTGSWFDATIVRNALTLKDATYYFKNVKNDGGKDVLPRW